MKKNIKKSTENEYHKFRKYFVFSCVDVIILKNNSVLLTKRTQDPHKGSWHVPGSIIRKNETMLQAVKRAAKNELNLNVKIKKYVDSMVVLFPFEKEWYAKRGLFVSYFGHPLAETYNNFLENFKNVEKRRVDTVALFPGSR